MTYPTTSANNTSGLSDLVSASWDESLPSGAGSEGLELWTLKVTAVSIALSIFEWLLP